MTARKPASGRFVLRLDPRLHARLRREAVAEGTSLNDYCARKLGEPPWTIPLPLREGVDRARALFGDDVAGVAAFGSWSRGEMSDGSDIDLLIVLERTVPLGRSLYRRWDEQPVAWNGRTVEPQFVSLPDEDEKLEGLWAEVALDGIIVFERGLKLSLRLVRLRREIATGRLIRRIVHGQPYWVRNEVA